MKRIFSLLLIVLLVQSTFAQEESDYEDQYEYVDLEEVYDELPQEQVEEEEAIDIQNLNTNCPPLYQQEEEPL